MRYSIQIKRFLYSQYFFGGLRIAIGISLPPMLMLLIFHNQALGFNIATGALGAAALDAPGPLKYKHNEMLAASVIGSLSAFATGLATVNPLSLWLTVVPLTFALSIIVVYGAKWPQISFVTLFMMTVTLESHFTPLQALRNAGWILAGALWMTYWSVLVSFLQINRLERQTLAECIFETAEYLRARADFYEPRLDLQECYVRLVARQIATVDRQDAAREIVLRNLPKLRAGRLDPEQTALFNLFINIVDLHETVVASHTDYALFRGAFGNTDVSMFFRDALRKAADELEEIGLAVMRKRASQQRVSPKAELRAIEYEIELRRKKALPVDHPEAYSALVGSYRRVWSATRLIARMHRNTGAATSVPEAEMRIDRALSGFLSPRRFTPTLIFSNLTMASPSFRHALRVTVAVACGLGLGKLLPLTNSYWIVLTIVVIMKPGFSLTKQRNIHRLAGTAIGCAASVALIVLVKDPRLLLLIMFACMVMSYSLLLFHYGASAVFTSAYLLILYHLLAAGNMRLIGERAVDTLIGGIIAVSASYLFPFWEYRVMGRFVTRAIDALQQYLEAVWALAGDGARGQGGPTVSATGSGGDLRYRLARKNVHVGFANLGNAFQRMMLEPHSKQHYVPELNNLLVQSHALAAQMTACAPLLESLGADDLSALAFAMETIRENLRLAVAGRVCAEDGSAVPRALTAQLDKLVVEAEQAAGRAPEQIDELKLLVHQCKQMIAASFLIGKDAAAMQLAPA